MVAALGGNLSPGLTTVVYVLYEQADSFTGEEKAKKLPLLLCSVYYTTFLFFVNVYAFDIALMAGNNAGRFVVTVGTNPGRAGSLKGLAASVARQFSRNVAEIEGSSGCDGILAKCAEA